MEQRAELGGGMYRANKCDSCHIFVDTVVQLFIVFNFLSVEIEVI